MILRKLTLFISFGFGFILLGCSGAKPDQANVLQIPNEAWWTLAANGQLKQIPPELSPVVQDNPAAFKNIAVVRKKIMEVSPTTFTLAFSDAADMNAYASLQNNQRFIILTNELMKQFGDDPDVLATVVGHELGHHQLGHTQPNYGKDRNAMINFASQTLGAISSYFIPFSGLIVGNAVKGAGLSYSRDDEREADLMGMKLALAAGFSPCGSYRFALQMNELGQSTSFAFLSTHPGNDERIMNSEAFNQSQKQTSCRKP